jgi:glyoxylase-like metal-dependent hydrolase (beta-lactamase superfamily II)
MGDSTILVLNCGSMRPPLGGLRAATICLAVETSAGWVLIDSGFGTHDFLTPCRRMRIWRFVFGLDPREEQAAVHQLAARGISAGDVRHVILTHLHFDHAGGLPDFPQARVHLLRREWEAARHPRTLLEFGYLPAQWSHDPAWVFHEAGEVDWHGRLAARLLPGIMPEMLLVPLPGHTRGHCGVGNPEAGRMAVPGRRCGVALPPAQRRQRSPAGSLPPAMAA